MTLKHRRAISAVGLVATAGVLFGVVAVWASYGRERPGCAVEAGQKFPDMTFSTLSGETKTTASLNGKSALLLFTTPDCPICKLETPKWRRLAEAHGDALTIWPITVGPSASRTAATRRDALPRDVLLDEQSEFSKTLGASRVPLTVLLDGHAVVQACFVGAQPTTLKQQALDRLMSSDDSR